MEAGSGDIDSLDKTTHSAGNMGIWHWRVTLTVRNYSTNISGGWSHPSRSTYCSVQMSLSLRAAASARPCVSPCPSGGKVTCSGGSQPLSDCSLYHGAATQITSATMILLCCILTCGAALIWHTPCFHMCHIHYNSVNKTLICLIYWAPLKCTHWFWHRWDDLQATLKLETLTVCCFTRSLCLYTTFI